MACPSLLEIESETKALDLSSESAVPKVTTSTTGSVDPLKAAGEVSSASKARSEEAGEKGLNSSES